MSFSSPENSLNKEGANSGLQTRLDEAGGEIACFKPLSRGVRADGQSSTGGQINGLSVQINQLQSSWTETHIHTSGLVDILGSWRSCVTDETSRGCGELFACQYYDKNREEHSQGGVVTLYM